MTEEVKTTPAEEAKKTEPTISEVVGEAKTEAKEETVGDVLSAETKEETVPLSRFLELKKENKDLSRAMKELKKTVEEGATKKEVAADIQALADKHGIDADFLEEFAATVKAKADSEVDEKISSKLKPIEEKERKQKINAVFDEHYEKAIAQVPEYDGVVNKEVIKSLSLNPANANKTFIQIIEEAYGHLITGKRSIDQASTRAGKNDSIEVDVARARKDREYFNEVMANPTLKKKYNESLTDRLSSHL